MKIAQFALSALFLTQVASSYAQFANPMGGAPKSPAFTGMAKLFGENSAFSANIEIQSTAKAGDSSTFPGKMALKDGKSRFEMDLSKMKGPNMPPEAAQSMKSMGMDQMVVISRPDRKLNYLIYPGMQAYAETALDNSQSADPAALEKFKVETTELGREKVDGHPCIKNQTVVTDEKGEKYESIVWNATDLKNFPIKIEHKTGDTTVLMFYKDVQLTPPDEKQFETPAGFTKYDSMQTMMQQQMMKQFGGGAPFKAR